jgi:hypothetical protein
MMFGCHMRNSEVGVRNAENKKRREAYACELI